MTARAQVVDGARGVALVAMIVYHACWFSSDEGLVPWDLGAPEWRIFQRSIAGAFYLLVGVSMALAHGVGRTSSTWRAITRLLRIAAAALVVTVASAVLDPDRVVTYGILHNIFVCSVLALPFRGRPTTDLIVGVGLVAVGVWAHVPLFDHPLLRWVGLGSPPGPSFDFQPLLPWLGVVLVGLFVGNRLAVQGTQVLAWRSDGRLPRGLGFLGRHSLLVYLGHVPMLVAITTLLARWRP